MDNINNEDHFQNPNAAWETRLLGWLWQFVENVSTGKIHEFAGRKELSRACAEAASANFNQLKDIIKEKI